MALQLLSPPLVSVSQSCLLHPKHSHIHRPAAALPSLQTSSSSCRVLSIATTSKKATCTDYDYMISLKSDYADEKHKKQVDVLKLTARRMLLDNSIGSSAKIEIIDDMQRLGISDHFQDEIKSELLNLYVVNTTTTTTTDHCLLNLNDLHTTALLFRLFRQHGHNVSQDSFKRFRDETGNFKANLCEDVKGMLSLYEASHLAFEGENIMEEAKIFTTNHLKQQQSNNFILTPSTLALKIAHSLDLPLHWRIPRVETRWYVDVYEREENMKPDLLELAKLDFNVVQAAHQNETSNVARWWTDVGLHKIGFVREKMMLNSVWWISVFYEPKYGHCREELTKITMLLTLLDDMYDKCVSVDDIHKFTDAVDRWDVSAMEQLPQYMKTIYLALLNVSNIIAYEVLAEHGYDITSHQKKAWGELCTAYLLERKWSLGICTPTSLKEYLAGGTSSIGVALTLVHCYLLTTKSIKREAIEEIVDILHRHTLVYIPSLTMRLADDLHMSKEEGNTKRAVECYMEELGITEGAARQHITDIIANSWKRMNKALVEPHPFSDPLPSAAINYCRIAQNFMPKDDLVETNTSLKDPMALVFQPISLN